MIDNQLRKILVKAQSNEITESVIYSKLAQKEKKPENQKVLRQIADDEKRHYEFWKTHTNTEIKPRLRTVCWYYLIGRILGLTFSIKLMERGEEKAQVNYSDIAQNIPQAKEIEADENRHENSLIAMIDEERLSYVGSMVLGLNDALVELTGALAGLTFALQNTRLVALAGLITGIAASLSMAASEYLSTKTESGHKKNPLKAAVYTGVAYVITVVLLILPYLLFTSPLVCLGLTLAAAMVVILIFTFYISVAQDLPFGKRFLEMAGISIGVATITFGIGFVIRHFWDIEV